MKKFIVLIIFLFIFILVGCQETEITETRAVELAKLYIESVEAEAFIQSITNYDAPIVENLDLDRNFYVWYFEERDAVPQQNDLKGKTVWKITFTTTFDNLFGPYEIFLDKYSGEIYGVTLEG